MQLVEKRHKRSSDLNFFFWQAVRIYKKSVRIHSWSKFYVLKITRNTALTVGFPQRFDYLIVDQKYDGGDQDRRQHGPGDEVEVRGQEQNGQEHEGAGVDVGHRRLDAAGLAQGAPGERAARGHRPDERPDDVAQRQGEHLLRRLHRAAVS